MSDDDQTSSSCRPPCRGLRWTLGLDLNPVWFPALSRPFVAPLLHELRVAKATAKDY